MAAGAAERQPGQQVLAFRGTCTRPLGSRLCDQGISGRVVPQRRSDAHGVTIRTDHRALVVHQVPQRRLAGQHPLDRLRVPQRPLGLPPVHDRSMIGRREHSRPVEPDGLRVDGHHARLVGEDALRHVPDDQRGNRVQLHVIDLAHGVQADELIPVPVLLLGLSGRTGTLGLVPVALLNGAQLHLGPEGLHGQAHLVVGVIQVPRTLVTVRDQQTPELVDRVGRVQYVPLVTANPVNG